MYGLAGDSGADFGQAFEDGLVLDLADFNLLCAVGYVESAESIKMKAARRCQIENHDGDAVVLSQIQDARHFGLSVWDPRGLFANGLNALRKSKERLVDARGFDEALFAIVCAAIVLGASEVDGRDGAGDCAILQGLGELDAEYGVGARRVRVQLGAGSGTIQVRSVVEAFELFEGFTW